MGEEREMREDLSAFVEALGIPDVAESMSPRDAMGGMLGAILLWTACLISLLWW